MKDIFEKFLIETAEKVTDGIISEFQKNKTPADKKIKTTIRKEDLAEPSKNIEQIKAKSDKPINISKQYKMEKEIKPSDDDKINILNAYSRNRRLNIMITCAALGLIFCLIMLTSYKLDLPGEVVGIISTVSGIFGACLKDAYSFEFGSSRGSKDKDDKISATILDKLQK